MDEYKSYTIGAYTGSGITILSGITLSEWGILVGILLGILTFILNWYFQRKRYQDYKKLCQKQIEHFQDLNHRLKNDKNLTLDINLNTDHEET